MAYLMSQILLCVILGIGTKRLACETCNVTPPSTYTEYNRSIAQAVGVKHDTHRRTGRGGRGGHLPPQFGQFVDMNSGRESTLFGQNTIHV